MGANRRNMVEEEAKLSLEQDCHEKRGGMTKKGNKIEDRKIEITKEQ